MVDDSEPHIEETEDEPMQTLVRDDIEHYRAPGAMICFLTWLGEVEGGVDGAKVGNADGLALGTFTRGTRADAKRCPSQDLKTSKPGL